jgi:hypothetical protein
MALPPLPPCGEVTKGRTIKVKMVLIVLSLRAEARGLLPHQATANTSTNQLKNSEPNRAPGLRPGRMREQQG